MPGHGPFLICLRLNGTTDAIFAVDTGANFCSLSQSLVRKLGLTPVPAVGDTGQPLLWHGKQADEVTVSNTEFTGATVLKGKIPHFDSQMLVMPDDSLVFPGDPSRPHALDTRLDGVFGTILLKFFACGFDFAAHTLTLSWPGQFSAGPAQEAGYNSPGGQAIPLTSDTPDSFRFFVPVRLTNGAVTRQTSLAVDTGSDETIIPRSLAHDLGLKKTGQERQYGLERDYRADETRVGALGLGGVTVADAPLLYPDTGDYPPVLGMDVLSRFRVLLDFPGKAMYLAPAGTPVPVPTPSPSVPSPADVKPAAQ